ncbi:hypothetical protein TCAL_14842 [Tigriopus californicus]|uniref:Uncharacterized protein n=1 Tax=Tigriopus californicus TaxID=6832 RepID=A0A553P4H8_TIGCA|nr:hypothetical protein TCAL_14842 [Tigriopus californicus]
MGIVASLASAPVAVEIFKDELRHQEERRKELKYGHFQVGDTDLIRIKKLTSDLNDNDETMMHNREGAIKASKGVEKIYLTGVYKKKFEYISNKTDKNGTAVLESPYGTKKTPGRKTRSAYPIVRLH